MHESPHHDHQSNTEKLLTVKMGDIAANIALCVVSGEIDLCTGPLLQKKLAKATHVAPRQLVVDLSGVQFLGSIGLKILVEVNAAQQNTGHQLALVVGNNRMVTRPLQATGLDHEFDLHSELATAVTACRTAEGVRGP